MKGNPSPGGKPDVIAQCTVCGEIHPVQIRDDTLRPVGAETCSCGNDEFVPLSER